jgi:hypothetical protein
MLATLAIHIARNCRFGVAGFVAQVAAAPCPASVAETALAGAAGATSPPATTSAAISDLRMFWFFDNIRRLLPSARRKFSQRRGERKSDAGVFPDAAVAGEEDPGPMGRFLAWTAVGVVAVVAVGWLAIALLKALLGVAVYLIVGAAVVGGGVYLYRKGKRAISRDQRMRNRIEAATVTYRQRNR